MKLIKEIRMGDIFLVCALTVICILWFLPGSDSGRLKAQVILDGECVEECLLSEITEDKRVKIAGCEILFEKDAVTFINSECPDKLCEKRGRMTAPGDVMACVPQKVVVILSSEKDTEFDSVAY